MVSSSPPSPPPSSAHVLYSKIGAPSSSSSSLHYSSAGHERVLQHFNKLRGRAVACAATIGSICLLVVTAFILLTMRGEGPPKLDSASPPMIAPSPPPLIAPSPSDSAPVQPLPLSPLCNTTGEAKLCLKTLSSFPSTQSIAPLQDLTAFVAKTAWACLNETYLLAMNLSRIGRGSSSEKAVLQDCLELLDQAGDGLHDSIDQLSNFNLHEDFKVVHGQVMNVRVRMSSSYTEQDTCWDEFQDLDGSVKDQLLKSGRPIAPLISIALSFANVLQQVGLSTMYAVHSFPP